MLLRDIGMEGLLLLDGSYLLTHIEEGFFFSCVRYEVRKPRLTCTEVNFSLKDFATGKKKQFV